MGALVSDFVTAVIGCWFLGIAVGLMGLLSKGGRG